jgi:F-type H+-transporting ATPase subunit epsilon
MAKKIILKIVTPERVVYEAEIDQVTLPTTTGEITILPDHVPLISVLSAGELLIKLGNKEIPMAVQGGFVEVAKNKVVVLADSADRIEEIDEQRAEEARKRAEELIKTKKMDASEFAALSAQLEREMVRLKIVRKHRRTTLAPTPKVEE